MNKGVIRMNKLQVEARLRQYLKSHFINFEVDIDNDVPRYTMIFQGYDNAPNKAIETCIWLYNDEMEVRTYYPQVAAEWCKDHCKNIPMLMRLFNYINAMVLLKSADGAGGSLYQPHHLHTPRIYMTEDDCFDITLTTVICYDFYEVAPLETEDYITAFCPELLANLSPAIFGLLLDLIDFESAKQYIQINILKNK